MLKIFLFLFVVTGLVFPQGKPIKVFATTDTTEYTVGDYIEYQLKLSYDKNIEVVLPAIKDSVKNLDYIKQLPAIKNELNGRVSEMRRFIFAGYDSAKVTIPSYTIQYKYKNSGKVYSLTVNPVDVVVRTMDIDPKSDIQDVKSPIKIPLDWLFISIIVLIILLLALAGYFGYKYYKKKHQPKEYQKVVIKIPPYKIAVEELEKLENEKLWQQGKIKDYHSRITTIIRKYFEKRFNFSALEMPSSEVLDNLSAIPKVGKVFDDTRLFFENADLVKFAKFKPMPSVNEEMMKQAYQIVRDTKSDETANINTENTDA